MRALVLVLLLTSVASGPAVAAPTTGWVGLSITVGPAPGLHGELGDRSAAGCVEGTCQSMGRFGFSVMVGRWGGDLQVAVFPFRDRSPGHEGARTAEMWGPHLRCSAFHWQGFDLSPHLGLEHGSLWPDSMEEPDYPAWDISAGVTLAWRHRIPAGWFLGLAADASATALRAAYPDGKVYGLVTDVTFGLQLGVMFDVR